MYPLRSDDSWSVPRISSTRSMERRIDVSASAGRRNPAKLRAWS